MTWAARLRMTVGLLGVLALGGWLTMHLNETKGEALSVSAAIATETYAVGSSYAGLLVEQDVEVGDTVSAGQALFVIDSAALRQDLQTGLVDADLAESGIAPDGTLTVTAAADGVVTDLAASRGTFVQAGTQLATVDKAQTLTVRAVYTLAPEQFARLEEGAAAVIGLPDGSSLDGRVQRIQVETVGGQAQTVLTVTSDQLILGAADGLVAPGTPVQTVVSLRNDGVVTDVADRVQQSVRDVLSAWGR